MRVGIAPAHRPERSLGPACAALFISQTLASSCGGCGRQPRHAEAVCVRLRGGGMPWREHFTSQNFESTGASSAYACECGADLTLSTDVLSKSFQGQEGRGMLVSRALNIYLGPLEDRVLVTGLSTVRDVHCRLCTVVLGWKYVETDLADQGAKEGRLLLERARLIKLTRDKALGEWVPAMNKGGRQGTVVDSDDDLGQGGVQRTHSGAQSSSDEAISGGAGDGAQRTHSEAQSSSDEAISGGAGDGAQRTHSGAQSSSDEAISGGAGDGGGPPSSLDGIEDRVISG